jgi:hypothetical protein
VTSDLTFVGTGCKIIVVIIINKIVVIINIFVVIFNIYVVV